MQTSFKTLLNGVQIFKPSDIKYVIAKAIPDEILVTNNKQITYFNIPIAFDIETSSFYVDDVKQACMYEWTLGINGLIIIGRTWSEFLDCMQILVTELELNDKTRIIIYCHNLAYEFQWISKYFNWLKVFSVNTRKPVYAVTEDGIEFRCSYILSGYSLAKLGEQLHTYKISKLVGALDYDKVRLSITPMTDLEYQYCINDVKVVMAYIQEQIEAERFIIYIPLTNTGYVRRYVKKECLGAKKTDKRKKYVKLIKSLHLDPEEYQQLQRAFQGGFTHANPIYSGQTIYDVASIDFTSSYPAVMVSEEFPMSASEIVHISNKEEFEKNIKLYNCLFDVQFINLKPKVLFDNYISSSKAWNVVNAIYNNGRIVSADELHLTVTEVDWNIIKMFYTWDNVNIFNFRRYQKYYLPTDFVKAILKLYSDKTTLKGVSGKEVEYLLSKGMLNSCYGMAVTSIVRPEIEYTSEWVTHEPDLSEQILKYNKSMGRFLFYPWGVWVTAYARYNLISNLYQIGLEGDYIYTDTDSIKFTNYDEHKKLIENYNVYIRNKLIKAMKYHQLPVELIEPETIKGVKKCLGVFDYEGTYTRYKTLGAKRYMVEEDDHISITVSGLNKKVTVPYLIKEYGDKVFENFNDGLYIPAEYTGKNTHTYIDEEISGEVTDYLGNKGFYHELSAIHMQPSDYDLSLSRLYVDYLRGVKYERDI